MRSKIDKREIEYIAVSELTPYARNSRTHSPAQVKQIAASIREFGFTNPVLIDNDNGIIAGHGRVMAAEHLQLADVPCIRLGYLTETQKRAYVIADNKLALNAAWDDEMLRLELDELNADNFDVGLLGFEPDELSTIMGLEDDKEVVEDEVPEPPAEPITKPGDLWILGEHRLLCGDSTKVDDVERLMNGEKAKLCLTDPPYGLGSKKQSGKNDYDQYEDTKSNLVTLVAGWLPIARSMCASVIFSPGVTNAWIYPEADWIMCWFYGGGHLLSSWGYNCWQPFLCYGKDPSLATGNGGRPDGVNMNTPANAEDIDHPCPKPVKLWVWFMERMSFEKGDLFYEPFGGSGTTIIAAEQLGRKCYGMEISPQYCDVIVKRWETFTGKKAVLSHE